MRSWLMLMLLALALTLTGCATYQRSAATYPTTRPVDGVAIRDADWAACDLEADQQGARAVTSRRGARHGYGAIAGSMMAQTLDLKSESPAETAVRESTYNRELRGCLVNRGYPVTVPPIEPTTFGPKP